MTITVEPRPVIACHSGTWGLLQLATAATKWSAASVTLSANATANRKLLGV